MTTEQTQPSQQYQVVDPVIAELIQSSVRQGPGHYLLVVTVDEKGVPSLSATKLGAGFTIDPL